MARAKGRTLAVGGDDDVRDKVVVALQDSFREPVVALHVPTTASALRVLQSGEESRGPGATADPFQPTSSRLNCQTMIVLSAASEKE